MAVELSTEEKWKAIAENCCIPGYPTEFILKRKHWPLYVEGHGIYLRDTEGRDYIDATSGFMCVTLGHGNKKVIEAAKEQLDKLQYTLPGHNAASIKLCRRIAELTPGDLNHVFLGLSGSDVNEAALTLARQYSKNRGKPSSIIVSQWHSYHGGTLDAASITGLTGPMKATHGRDVASVNNGVYHIAAPYCYRCDYGLEYPSCGIQCAKALDVLARSLGPDNIAAFVGEPVLGSMGSVSPPPEYYPMVRQICDEYGFLLVMDEVMTGWGRTGKLFACNHWNVVPDIMTMGKGISSAYLPVAAVVFQDHINDAFRGQAFPYGGHTHSFYPPGAACALAAIDVLIEERLCENAAKVGAHLKERLERICQESAIVGAVHGMGLHLGLEIVEDKVSKKPGRRLAASMWTKCEEKGVLIMREDPNLIPIVPPLIITLDETDHLCDVISEAVKETEATRKK
jgi:adenosylmethionine-8-amino-7-oxononanoate aminotransferase